MAQQAEFTKVAACRQTVVERAIAPEDFDRAAAHHMPEFRGLAEVDDLLAGLVVTHIDRRRHAVLHRFRQAIEGWVGAEKIEDFELFNLHGISP